MNRHVDVRSRSLTVLLVRTFGQVLTLRGASEGNTGSQVLTSSRVPKTLGAIRSVFNEPKMSSMSSSPRSHLHQLMLHWMPRAQQSLRVAEVRGSDIGVPPARTTRTPDARPGFAAERRDHGLQSTSCRRVELRRTLGVCLKSSVVQ